MIRQIFNQSAKRKGRARLFSFNIPNFDKRKLMRFHGDLAYDKFEDIYLDQHSFQRQFEKEISEAKKFYSELENSDIFNDIRNELSERGVSNIAEPPEVLGNYEYFNVLKVTQEANYYALMRRKLDTKEEQTCFDPLKDKPFAKKYLNTHSLMGFSLSDDEQSLGVSIDIKSNELPTGFIKDLKQNRLLPDRSE